MDHGGKRGDTGCRHLVTRALDSIRVVNKSSQQANPLISIHQTHVQPFTISSPSSAIKRGFIDGIIIAVVTTVNALWDVRSAKQPPRLFSDDQICLITTTTNTKNFENPIGPCGSCHAHHTHSYLSLEFRIPA